MTEPGQTPSGYEHNLPPSGPGQPQYPGQYPPQHPGSYPAQQYPQQQYPQQQYPQQQYAQHQYAQHQYPPPYGAMPPGYGYPAAQPNNGLGVAGFVCGLLGLIFFWVPFVGLVLGVLGVILGGAGIFAGRKSGAGTGLAIAGLVCGIVSLVPAVLIIAAVSNA